MEEQDQARTLQHTSIIDNTSVQNERNVQSDQNRVFQGSNFLSHLSHPFGQYSTIYAGSKYNLAKTTATKDHQFSKTMVMSKSSSDYFNKRKNTNDNKDRGFSKFFEGSKFNRAQNSVSPIGHHNQIAKKNKTLAT